MTKNILLPARNNAPRERSSPSITDKHHPLSSSTKTRFMKEISDILPIDLFPRGTKILSIFLDQVFPWFGAFKHLLPRIIANIIASEKKKYGTETFPLHGTDAPESESVKPENMVTGRCMTTTNGFHPRAVVRGPVGYLGGHPVYSSKTPVAIIISQITTTL